MMQSKQLLIGKKYIKLFNTLNFSYIPDNPKIDERLSSHVDLSVYYDGIDTIFADNYLKDFDFPLKTIFLDLNQSPKYPYDVQLNICNIGKFAILNESFVPNIIIDHLYEAGKSIINVNQGYSNCLTLAVDDFSIITSDVGIYDATIKKNLNALLIHQGYFDLEGFEYGFIGGSSIHISNELIAFTGNIDNHPDKKEIFDFIKKRNKKITYLTEKNAFDIGGAIEI